MPKLSKDSAPNVQDAGPAVDHNGDLDDITVSFVTIRRATRSPRCCAACRETAASARTGGTCWPARSPSATPTARRPTRRATPSI